MASVCNTGEEQETTILPPPPSYKMVLGLMSRRRTWILLAVLVGLLYATILYFSWNFIQFMLSWYKLQVQPSSSSSGLSALFASVLFGAVFGLLSMVAALAVMLPVSFVTWITIMVLLAFFGKRRRRLVVEERKITREIVGVLIKILFKEGKVVAALCAVLGYYVLFRRKSEEYSVNSL